MSDLNSFLRELEEKADAATPGERSWDEDLSPDGKCMSTRGLFASGNKDVLFGFDYNIEVSRPDAEFIAAANPDTIKKLIAVIRKQQSVLSLYANEGINNHILEDLHLPAVTALEDCEKIVRGDV